jgi:hypothetical protein
MTLRLGYWNISDGEKLEREKEVDADDMDTSNESAVSDCLLIERITYVRSGTSY